jgi:hypothetical protein
MLKRFINSLDAYEVVLYTAITTAFVLTHILVYLS